LLAGVIAITFFTAFDVNDVMYIYILLNPAGSLDLKFMLSNALYDEFDSASSAQLIFQKKEMG
jgi:hypothetical protein